MDDIDKGNETAEKTLQGYINRVRAQLGNNIKPTGFCLNCAEECGGRLFCCTECREDFEKRENIHRSKR